MFKTLFIQRSVIGLAVLTVLGILVHDTKFDKAVIMSLPVAAVVFGASSHAVDFGNSAHTHVERVHLSNALSSIPRIQPRNDQRRHYLQKHISRGDDFSGGNRIFWPSV